MVVNVRIEPAGKIVYKKQDTIDPAQMKKLIKDLCTWQSLKFLNL